MPSDHLRTPRWDTTKTKTREPARGQSYDMFSLRTKLTNPTGYNLAVAVLNITRPTDRPNRKNPQLEVPLCPTERGRTDKGTVQPELTRTRKSNTSRSPQKGATRCHISTGHSAKKTGRPQPEQTQTRRPTTSQNCSNRRAASPIKRGA